MNIYRHLYFEFESSIGIIYKVDNVSIYAMNRGLMSIGDL